MNLFRRTENTDLVRDILRTIIALAIVGSATALALRGVIDAAAVTALMGGALGALGATAAVAAERHQVSNHKREGEEKNG